MLDRLNALGAHLWNILRWGLRLITWPFRAVWRFVRWLPRALWRTVRWLWFAPLRLARWLFGRGRALTARLYAKGRTLLRWPVEAVRQRRWRQLAALGAAMVLTAVLAANGLYLLQARLTRAPVIYPAVTALTLAAPPSIRAGEPLTVTITAQPPVSGTVVILMGQGTPGLAAQAQPLADGSATFVLPPANTSGAGALALTAASGATQAQATVIIEPGPAADPLLTVAGPRSIMAGGDEAMVVTLPLDAAGNAVNDDSLITVQAQQPAPAGQLLGPLDALTQGTHNLLTALRVRSREVAGPLLLAASGSGAHSLAQTIRIQPAPPFTVTVRATPDQAPADGESAVRLQTSRLTDAYGNQVLDGVVTFFLVESSDGTRRWLPATVFDGVASTLLPAPVAPVEQTVRAWVAGVLSPPVNVSFRPGAAVRPFDLVVEHSGDATKIVAGPILGELNQLVPDDTVVTFTFYSQGDAARTLTGTTVYGYASVTVYAGELPAGAYTVVATMGNTAGETLIMLPAPDHATEAAP